METIYTLTGWVKKIIDNERAQTLDEIRIDAIGDLGRDTLLKMAKSQLEYWNQYYPNKKRKYRIAYMCCVCSNNICDVNNVIVRDKAIFAKLIKTEIKTK